MNIGNKLSNLRKAKKLTQRDLASRSGMTRSSISLIETNQVSPSVSTMQKILNAFDMTLSEFFAAAEADNAIIHSTVIPAEHLVEIGNNGVSMKLICNGNKDRNLGFLIEVYEPGSTTGEQVAHEGEEAGTILEGQIEMYVDGETFHLKTGDSYAIDTSKPHRFTNHSKKVCRLISAHTPASF